jgi:hypothetical protein
MIVRLYGITIFVSAFLLFQVQPIIARMILPWFGGSSAVWSTCMMFFQLVLLLGYLYAHWLHSRFKPRTQVWVHLGLLVVGAMFLPILPDPSWKPSPGDNPSLRILGLLGATIGLPYFLLSTTSPLIQAWFTRSNPGVTPYRLFALSNLASMLALLGYPPLIEPNLTVKLQGLTWSFGYGLFTLLCAWTAWSGGRIAPESAPVQVAASGEKPPLRRWSIWLSLAACASTLLLTVTAYLTQDVAAIPFLWIAPLSVYLLSFILCFEAPRHYRRKVYLPLGALSLFLMAFLQRPAINLKAGPTVAIFVAALYVCCMVCHGELAALKPDPRYLTIFYVMVSVGGAVGGIFVALVAPNVFNFNYEFPIGLAVTAALLAAVVWRGQRQFFIDRRRTAALLAGVAAYWMLLGDVVRNEIAGYSVLERNFYGSLRVQDVGAPGHEDSYRKLVHGQINHGEQMRNEQYRRSPVSYFCPDTGIGRAMRTRAGERPRRLGVLGLGCGTLAAYGRAGDTLRIYEINPLVVAIAERDFTYLRDTAAKVEVALGDGRLVLEQEAPQQFDVLVMDAFSGDSVPVHLITREAFQTYFRHLKPGGILAVNISNKYLSLDPVIERAAKQFGRIPLVFHYDPPDEDSYLCLANSWVLLVEPATLEAQRPLLGSGDVIRENPGFRAWTDDFSNMYRILKWKSRY